jgi:very-short-patch-repair endonuclease
LAVSLGNKAAVVDADWALRGENWDEKLWLRPGLLKAMGWTYIRVHALEIFAQPQDVANRIAKQLGLDLERKAQPLF